MDLTTYDPTASGDHYWSFTFDVSGNITDWNLFLADLGTNNFLGTEANLFTIGHSTLAQVVAGDFGNTPLSDPGVWSMAIPEPASITLALAALCLAVRRQR